MVYFTNQRCHYFNPIVTMGTFDGVHKGHQKILKKLRERADETNGTALVITYYHHPLEIIHRKTFPYLLTERRQKKELLHKYGADCVLYLNFTKEMARMSAEEFLKEILIDEVHMSEIIVGYDTHFGKYREGDKQFLFEMGKKYKYDTVPVEPYKIHNRIISSSMIRDFIREGNIKDAGICLGRDYSLSGKIVMGQQLGRSIGFPTINIQTDDPYKLIPAIGVYVTDVFIDDKKLLGVTNIGYSPTLKKTGIKEVETFIIDFDEDVYDKEVKITFKDRIRDEKNFSTPAELIKNIKNDVIYAKKYRRHL